LVRLHPPAGPAGRNGWPHLQLSDLAAYLAPHLDRQPAVAEAGVNQRGQVQPRPAVAASAVTRELVLVTVQAQDAAEINHGWTVTAGWLTG